MRELRLIKNGLEKFNLDLTGLTVFTEAATGHFRWTPIIALLANAARVYALAKDSTYGSKAEAAQGVASLARQLGVEKKLSCVFDDHDLTQADIITNLGFVRPITRERIMRLRPTAVIPLMWETWEFRQTDLDLRTCFEQKILTLGTNEMDPRLRIFDYIGLLALKLLFEADIEIYRSKILVVGGQHFGEATLASLNRNHVVVKAVCSKNHLSAEFQIYWLSESLASDSARVFIQSADALVFVEHHCEDELLGPNGQLTGQALYDLNPDIRLVHITGLIDSPHLKTFGFSICPERTAALSRQMSVTTAHLGPKPLIELHTAGLKVGEEMARARLNTISFGAAKRQALTNPLCHDFEPEHLKRLLF